MKNTKEHPGFCVPAGSAPSSSNHTGRIRSDQFKPVCPVRPLGLTKWTENRRFIWISPTASFSKHQKHEDEEEPQTTIMQDTPENCNLITSSLHEGQRNGREWWWKLRDQNQARTNTETQEHLRRTRYVSDCSHERRGSRWTKINPQTPDVSDARQHTAPQKKRRNSGCNDSPHQ